MQVPVSTNQAKYDVALTPTNSYMKFYWKDRHGVTHDLLNTDGIEILTSLEISLPTNAERHFNFIYRVTDAFSDVGRLLGTHKNEVWVECYRNGKKTIIFDGYVWTNTPEHTNESGTNKFRCECIGTEQIYADDFVTGNMGFSDITSKGILDKVSKELQKKTGHHRSPIIAPASLDQKWLDVLTIDGAYFRLFNIIKDREHCNFIYKDNGQVEFYVLGEQKTEHSIDSETFGNEITPITVQLINDEFVNNVIFRYDNVKGAVHKEMNTIEDTKTCNTAHEIFDIIDIQFDDKSIMNEFKFDPKLSSDDKGKKYTFNSNMVMWSGAKPKKVLIEYWAKESGVYRCSYEHSILEEDDKREHSSPIFTTEISNQRIHNISDIMSYCDRYIKWKNTRNYELDLIIKDLTVDHPLCSDIYDTNKYHMDIKPRSISFNGDEIIESRFHEDDIHNKNTYFYVASKTYSILIHDGGDKIPLQNMAVRIKLTTDQTKRWETLWTKDVYQRNRREHPTINVIMNDCWDAVKGAVHKDSMVYTQDDLTTQSRMADVTKWDTRGHIMIEENREIVSATKVDAFGNGADFSCSDKWRLEGLGRLSVDKDRLPNIDFSKLQDPENIPWDCTYRVYIGTKADGKFELDTIAAWMRQHHPGYVINDTGLTNFIQGHFYWNTFIYSEPDGRWIQLRQHLGEDNTQPGNWHAEYVSDSNISDTNVGFSKPHQVKFKAALRITLGDTLTPAKNLRDDSARVTLGERGDNGKPFKELWYNPVTDHMQTTPVIPDARDKFRYTPSDFDDWFSTYSTPLKRWLSFQYHGLHPSHLIDGDHCGKYPEDKTAFHIAERWIYDHTNNDFEKGILNTQSIVDAMNEGLKSLGIKAGEYDLGSSLGTFKDDYVASEYELKLANHIGRQ